MKPTRGCLAAVAIILVVVGFIAGIFFFITDELRSSPVYVQALKAAQSDPASSSGWARRSRRGG